jgi:hypothetical protein
MAMATEEFSRQGPIGVRAVDENGSSEIILQVSEALRGLKFGQVTITVHDGAVVQIERLERTRLQRRAQ